MNFALLVIAHLLGDFYFQTDVMAEKKQSSFGMLLLHCLVYTVVIYIMICALMGEVTAYLRMALIIGGSHIFIDCMKIEIEKKYINGKAIFFVVDQIIHIIVLYCAYLNLEIKNFLNLGIYEVNVVAIIISILICGKPAAIIISLVLDMLNNSVQQSQTISGQGQNYLKVGSWIGILEREIILILGILRQYEAIGFVLAAKSLARHRQLNDPDFAEKYLVGTLLSSLIALICAIICVILINPSESILG